MVRSKCGPDEFARAGRRQTAAGRRSTATRRRRHPARIVAGSTWRNPNPPRCSAELLWQTSGPMTANPTTTPAFTAAFARSPRPRDQRRAVLRPGVRVRGDAALAHAARAPDAGRRIADRLPAARRVVGVDVHLLVHQLDRPGPPDGSHADVPAHARRPADVRCHPARLRSRGSAVRDCVFLHPGGAHAVHRGGFAPSRSR